MSAQRPNLTPILGYRTSLWEPKRVEILSISQSNPCIITTVTDHNYQPGIYVRIFLPSEQFGMRELNEKIYPATILSSTTFSIPVDSRSFQAFASVDNQTAQVLPSGEDSLTLENTVHNATTVVPVGIGLG